MTRLHRGTRDLIKEINANLVLNIVRSREPVSRTEISRLSGLSRATVSGITAKLIDRNLIYEEGEGESTGGRRPTLLCLNNEAGYVVGVKLRENRIMTVLTDLDANVVHQQSSSLVADEDGVSERDISPDRALAGIAEAVETTIRGSGVERELVLGVGLGMAGIVDGETGICRYSPFFGWRDVQLSEPLSDAVTLPVHLENNVNTLTIAEQWFGYGHGVDHFVVATVGRGVGAGIVMNGQFYRGAFGGAGEFGHITLVEDGPPCSCGKRGCLEALASDPAVVRQARAAIALGERTMVTDSNPLSLETIVAAAEAGDTVAQTLLADSGRWLGIGIANLINVLNPELVIVAGEGVAAGDWRLNPLRDALQAHVFNGLADHLEIVVEPSGDETWARGAACVVLGELFRSPVGAEKAFDWTAMSP